MTYMYVPHMHTCMSCTCIMYNNNVVYMYHMHMYTYIHDFTYILLDT